MNPLVQTEALIQNDAQDQIFRARVSGIDGNEVLIIRDGGAETEEGPYARGSGMPALAVGDEVIVARVGTGYVILLRLVRNGLEDSGMYPFAGTPWRYAASGTGGITNTSEVTIKAAAGAGIRNYLTSLVVINAHASTGTEVVIKDGPSGAVIHRGYAGPAGGGWALTFPVPLRSSPTTALVAQCVTTSTATHVSAAGFERAD